MAIEFSCGSCGKRYLMDDALAGKKVRCAGCRAVARVAGPAPQPEPEPPPARRPIAAPIPSPAPAVRVTRAMTRPAPTRPEVRAPEPEVGAEYDGEDAAEYAAEDAPIPGGSLASKASLAIRAVLALGLMIGFYVLAAAVAGVFLYLLYREWRFFDRTHQLLGFALTVACGGVAAVILWSTIPRFWDEFRAPGLLLEPDDHPRLFDELAGVAAALGQGLPDEVYLCPDVNAWVTRRGGTLGLGGRRVMGVGLPLMQVLTVAQFRAVMAHEFGHFHGGDTLLGPWVYTTQAAIVRTLRNVKVSALRRPFILYFKLFLSVTGAVSRREEFAADALAARVAGSRAFINGLRRVNGAGAAFGAYLRGEIEPALGAGFRLPFAEGFDRFLRAAAVSRGMQSYLRVEIAHRRTDPYDTHPPLRERIDAVRGLDEGPAPDADPAAITLLEGLPRLERDLFAHMIGAEQAADLRPARWDEAATRIYLPTWKAHLREYAEVLEGISPLSLPPLARNIVNFGWRLARSVDRELGSPEEAAELACAVVGAVIAVSLCKKGWSMDASPGAAISLSYGPHHFEPFGVFPRLATGELSAEQWRSQCATYGLVDPRHAPGAIPLAW